MSKVEETMHKKEFPRLRTAEPWLALQAADTVMPQLMRRQAIG